MMYYIYHVPGKKIGATINSKRVQSQNGEIIYEGSMELTEASIWEMALADSYGYTRKSTLEHMDMMSKLAPVRYGKDAPNYGTVYTQEMRDKMSRPGDKNGMYGKNHTEETLVKMRVPKTEEHKAKLRGPKPKYQCIHCMGMYSPGMLTRWHNDNCKKREK